MRPQRRLRLNAGAALAATLALPLVLVAGCGDAPERAREPVDTAALQDRLMFEGDVGRDTTDARDTVIAVDTGLLAVPVESPRFVLLADSAAGFLLYHRKAGCLACHGAEGEGLAHLGPSLRDGEWLHIDGSLRSIERIIREGVARPRQAAVVMPALDSRLTEAEVFRVAAYVYTLSHPGAAVADTAAAAAAARDTLRPDTSYHQPTPPTDR
ncbi:MAG TPA: c-type cytochrome [Gemmatimonadaceae bacterium]|nr:c-type cytochrome [Gemmatimonadaceae bacterium]